MRCPHRLLQNLVTSWKHLLSESCKGCNSSDYWGLWVFPLLPVSLSYIFILLHKLLLWKLNNCNINSNFPVSDLKHLFYIWFQFFSGLIPYFHIINFILKAFADLDHLLIKWFSDLIWILIYIKLRIRNVSDCSAWAKAEH